ncbi:hypothetical protein ACWDTI_09625 [Gordonia sp. NPDC003424]
MPRNHNRTVVLIASGIGITPFRSMILAALAEGRDMRRLTVIHVIRASDRAVFADVLRAARDAGATVDVIESPSPAGDFGQSGRMGELIGPLRRGDTSPHYYLSGSPEFVTSASSVIRHVDAGTRWAFWRLHTDPFRGY